METPVVRGTPAVAPVAGADARAAVPATYDTFREVLAGAPTVEVPLVAPAAVAPVARVRSRADYTPDMRAATDQMFASFGMNPDVGFGLLAVADRDAPEGDAFDFLPADTAATVVSRCVSYREGSTAGQDLVDAVRAGRVTLTRRELAVLVRVRDAILGEQALDAMDYASGTDWIPMTEQRHCEVCGQFIGLRTAHIGCQPSSEMLRKVADTYATAEWQRVENLPAELFVEGAPAVRLSGRRDEPKSSLLYRMDLGGKVTGVQQILRPLPLSADVLQDLYCADDPYSGQVTARDVLLFHLDKPRFHGLRLPLPERLRRTFVEAPVLHTGNAGQGQETVAIVAALVDPPLQKHEIEHMIDVGGPFAARALLQVKRTRADALEVLGNYPSHAGAAVTQSGHVPIGTVRAMMDSPDPRLVRQAVLSPDLTDEDIARLMSHPSPDVRRALVDPAEAFAMDVRHPRVSAAGSLVSAEYLVTSYRRSDYSRVQVSVLGSHPALLGAFLNDPDDAVAEFSLERAAVTRQMLPALMQVTSRPRLERLRGVLYRRANDPAAREEMDLPARRERAAMIADAVTLIDRRLAA
jgi:hypothetical protein